MEFVTALLRRPNVAQRPAACVSAQSDLGPAMATAQDLDAGQPSPLAQTVDAADGKAEA
jgi:hypothetical protein